MIPSVCPLHNSSDLHCQHEFKIQQETHTVKWIWHHTLNTHHL